jgi:two-component system, OmpR family, sensor kinase
MNARAPRAFTSLRRRIVLATAVVTSLGMAALLVLVGVVLGRVVSDSIDSVLRDRADAVIATLGREGDSLTAPEAEDALEELVWVYDGAGRSVAGSAPPPLAERLAELRTADEVTTVDEGGWRLRAVPIVLDDETAASGVVVVGTALGPYRTTQALALLLTAGLGVFVIAGVCGLAAWVVGRALRPVTVMADRAAAWSEEDLTKRFDLGPPRDELTQLAHVLDGLLDRVQRTVLAEQRLTAELAHELRSPLTVIRAEAELAQSAPDVPAPQQERLARIILSVDSMSEVISTLLSIARGGARREETSPVVRIIAEASEGITDASGLEVRAPPVDLTAAVPTRAAAMALAPLLENALRYRRQRATVVVQPDGRFVHIEVSDDGPGFGSADPAQLFDPGFRDPESPGAGLGLSLARRLARTLGGDVTAARAGERTSFTLILPRTRTSGD